MSIEWRSNKVNSIAPGGEHFADRKPTGDKDRRRYEMLPPPNNGTAAEAL
jgi:hypothetical protein